MIFAGSYMAHKFKALNQLRKYFNLSIKDDLMYILNVNWLPMCLFLWVACHNFLFIVLIAMDDIGDLPNAKLTKLVEATRIDITLIC